MKKLPQILITAGCLLIIASILLFISIFWPVVSVEIKYNLNKPKTNIAQISPVDKNFGIVIPKIGANAKIIADVDPFNSNIYQIALTKGVAQAKDTMKPNETGNMFLFSHSSANLLEANRYNSVFYLLSKLEKNDEIYIFYKNVKYKYLVTGKKIVDPKDISYLNKKTNEKTLTLMTCWPAGTNFERLLIFATVK